MMSGASPTKRPVREARRRGADHERGTQVLQDGDGQRAVEAGVGRDREPPSQDIRVRIGVRDDHVRPDADDVLLRCDAELRVAVVAAQPGVDRGDRERRVREVALQVPPLFHLLHDGGVEADAEVEQEPAIGAVGLRGRSDADAGERARRERPEQLLRRPRSGRARSPSARANTLVDPPGNAASAVVVPTSPQAASLSVPSPASTTTTSTPELRRLARQLRRVAAFRGLDDLDVVLGRERLGDRRVVRASSPSKRLG